MRGHPVFRAQHATATCCRKCLAKWHAIERGRALCEQEVQYVVEVIDRWISQQLLEDNDEESRQLLLFPRDRQADAGGEDADRS